MNLDALFNQRIAAFVEGGPPARASGPLFHVEDDGQPGRWHLSARDHRGRPIALVRWHDVIRVPALARRMCDRGYTDADMYALLLVLTRAANLFAIDAGQRSNKDYALFGHVLHLLTLTQQTDAHLALRQHALYFLLFELDVDDEARDRVQFGEGRLLFHAERLGPHPLSEAVGAVYDSLALPRRRFAPFLEVARAFHLGWVHWLETPAPPPWRLALDAPHAALAHPDVFLATLRDDETRIFDALLDATSPQASTAAGWVSRLVLMHYGLHVLRHTPEAVLRLRDYVGDPTRFSLVLRALVTQGAVPDRGRFDALGLGSCLVPAG